MKSLSDLIWNEEDINIDAVTQNRNVLEVNCGGGPKPALNKESNVANGFWCIQVGLYTMATVITCDCMAG